MDDLYIKIRLIAYNSGFEIGNTLADEIHFRCSNLEVDDIENNIKACMKYAIDNGCDALINEVDNENIWDYC